MFYVKTNIVQDPMGVPQKAAVINFVIILLLTISRWILARIYYPICHFLKNNKIRISFIVLHPEMRVA